MKAGSQAHEPALRLAIPRDAVAGVNLIGFLEGELGLGEVARKLGHVLERAGVPFAAIPYRRTPSRQEHPLELPVSNEAPYDTNVVCLNANDLHAFVGDVGVDFFSGRYSIGVWFWESSVFRPDFLAGLRFLDEVWVASEYVRDAMAPAADVPVHVVPLPFEPPAPPTLTRAELGLPEGFMFLFAFDFVSALRKNPLAVVDAFSRAFTPAEGPVLVMKSINGRERKPRLLEELVAAARGRPDIHIVDTYFTAAERDAAIAACNCYVSLHRSEGFGLTVAEAMACGKPVIATGYSGNLDYLDRDSGYLVPYRLVAVPDEWWAHAVGAEWAEPDVDAAAALMREVYEDADAARARGERSREALLSTHSFDRSTAFVAGRLDAVRNQRRSVRAANGDARDAIRRVSHQLAKGVGASLSGTAQRPRFVRRLLMRALWPYLEEQQRLSTLTLDALTSLQRRVDELSARLASLEPHEDDARARTRDPEG